MNNLKHLKLLLALVLLKSIATFGQTYNITSGGTVSTCSGTFYDSGGSGGNYGNNEDHTMTFCSSSTNCISIEFNFLRIRNGDHLYVYDGTSTTDPLIDDITNINTGTNRTITSSSGCLTFRFTSNGSNVRAGWEGFISCVGCAINHTDGLSSATCSSDYFDSGGASGDAANNENSLTVICPSTPGDYVSINFTDWQVESGFDFLIIFDGGSASAGIEGIYSGTSPGTVTSSAADGCLSMRFISDGSVPSTGWEASISCVSSPGGGPLGPSLQDCSGQGGTTVCSDATFTGGSSGAGIQELIGSNRGCLEGNENESSWYYFSPATSGNIEFTITPAAGDDYDFAIWGPYSSLECPLYTNDTPIRCSWAAGTSDTGLQDGAGDNSENDFGDGFVEDLAVTAGQVYVLLVDNFSATTDPFDLAWTLTGGASLDCTPPLPVTLISQKVECDGGKRLFTWITGSETNASHFIVERSEDGFSYDEIGQVTAAGNSTTNRNYSFKDDYFIGTEAYYRIVQVDFDGVKHYKPAQYSYCPSSVIEVSRAYLNEVGYYLDLNSNVVGPAIVKVFDVKGSVVDQFEQTVNKGVNRLQAQRENAQSGIYFFTIELNGRFLSGKFSIEN